MKEGFAVFCMGLLMGMILLALMIKIIPYGNIHRYHKAIELCERDLPRDQKCEITARVSKDLNN